MAHSQPILAPITPAVLNEKQAAAYCGMCINTFTALNPPRPLSTGFKRQKRYSVKSLDNWIETLDATSNSGGSRMGDLAGGGQSARA